MADKMHNPFLGRIISILIAVCLALAISGCSLQRPKSQTANSPSSQAVASEGAARASQLSGQDAKPSYVMEVNGMPVQVDIARTPQEKTQGLSGRVALPEGRGMLFPYDEPVTPAFWMNGMLFSIDIIWINNGKVVDISENLPYPATLQASSRLPTFSPRVPVTGVLEVPAGWAGRNGVKVGADVVMPGI